MADLEASVECRWWLIYFEDQSRPVEIFTDSKAAHERYEQLSENWNCHLFEQVQVGGLTPLERKLRDALLAGSRFEKTDGKWHHRACRIMLDGACNGPSICPLIDTALAEADAKEGR